MIPHPLAERLAGCLLNRLAASHMAASELNQGRKLDHSILGLVSRVAGGDNVFALDDLLISALRSEVRREHENVHLRFGCACILRNDLPRILWHARLLLAGHAAFDGKTGWTVGDCKGLDSGVRLLAHMLQEKVLFGVVALKITYTYRVQKVSTFVIIHSFFPIVRPQPPKTTVLLILFTGSAMSLIDKWAGRDSDKVTLNQVNS